LSLEDSLKPVQAHCAQLRKFLAAVIDGRTIDRP
jgi:hypothetical protein